jgi:hypothetical protein
VRHHRFSFPAIILPACVMDSTTVRTGERTYRHNGSMNRTARLFDRHLQPVGFQQVIMLYVVQPG